MFAGTISAIVSAALVFTFLEPLFVVVGIELAVVALYILVLSGALVGFCLGVFLPTILPGACAGVALSAFIGSFFSTTPSIYFSIAAPSCALIGAGISIK